MATASGAGAGARVVLAPGELRGFHLRTLLMVANVGLTLALLVLFAIHGPSQYIDGWSVALAIGHCLVLSYALAFTRGPAERVVYVFVVANLLFYAHRPLFLLFDQFRYARFMTTDAATINAAMAFALACNVAFLVGIRLATATVRARVGERPSWYHAAANRKVLYVAGILVFGIQLALIPFLYASGRGRVWSDNVVAKVFLHFIVYNAIFLYVPIYLLVHRGIRKTSSEKLLLAALIGIQAVLVFATANKDAFLAALVVYLLAKIVHREPIFSRRFVAIALLSIVVLAFMFPLHHAVKTFWVQGGNVDARWQAAVAEYDLDHESVGDDLLHVSDRLAGYDWIAACMERQAGLRQYVSFGTFAKSLANRVVPLPTLPFPDTLAISAAMPIVVRGVSVEATKEFGEYPSFLGWMWLLVGPLGPALVLLFGFAIAAIVRRGVPPDIEVYLLSALIIDLYLGGDLVEEIKAIGMYLLIRGILHIFFVPVRAAPAAPAPAGTTAAGGAD